MSIELKIIYVLVALTSIAFNPFTSYEPFNAPKFLSLSILGVYIIFLLFRDLFDVKNNSSIFLLILLGLFAIQSIITLVFSDTPFTLQLFGIDGRNTGFITYLSLILALYFFASNTEDWQNLNLVIIFLLVAILNSVYGLVQLTGKDPVNWTNLFSPVFGFFGNPNFQSAFLGIAGGVVWALILNPMINRRNLFLLALLQCTFLINIFGTNSQQGLILFFSGLAFSILAKIYSSSWPRRAVRLYIVLIIFIFAALLLDIFKKSPWPSLLYKESVSERGDLWRAALRMSLDYPSHGVGFDGFEYFYRQYRDSKAIILRGSDVTSNSVHNVFLDILTNGGFPLLLIYFGILAFTLLSAFKVIRRQKLYNPYFVAILIGWINYQLQSLISINQIGLAIWGWVFSGAIIGYERKNRNAQQINKNHLVKRQSRISFLGLVLGFSLGLAPIRADINFRNAIESREIERVQKSAYSWPQSPQRMFQVSNIFRNNGLNQLSKRTAEDAVRKFPRSYENWRLLSSISLSETGENKEIEATLRVLDPLNPNN